MFAILDLDDEQIIWCPTNDLILVPAITTSRKAAEKILKRMELSEGGKDAVEIIDIGEDLPLVTREGARLTYPEIGGPIRPIVRK